HKYLQHCGNDQKIQRRAAVSQSPQHCRQSVIGTGNKKSCVNDGHILADISHQLLRGIHQPQDRLVQEQQPHCHNHYKKQTYINRHGNKMPHSGQTLSSEPLSHPNGKAAGQSVQPACHKKNQGTCASNGRQGVYSQKLSCHNGIRNIIKLLENISQTHRNHKLNDQFYRTSCRHIICHRKCTSRPSGHVVLLHVSCRFTRIAFVMPYTYSMLFYKKIKMENASFFLYFVLLSTTLSAPNLISPIQSESAENINISAIFELYISIMHG